MRHERWAMFSAGLLIPSPLEPLQDARLHDAGVHLFLKREDQIHPEVPGNKWRKLKYNIIEAASSGQGTLLTLAVRIQITSGLLPPLATTVSSPR
jgi:1-aminocyclopropane-1-carboxylate deaminase/D-cysteine desulfhydrase-like pyridoxal-dependent ACC family enzyme